MAKLYFPPTQNGLQKTLDAQLNVGVTSQMTLNNTTGVQNKPGVVVIDRIDTSGAEKSSAVREYISYTGVSGNNLTGLTRGLGGSTDQDHAVGAIVEFIPDVTVFQAINDVITTEHNTDGTHKTSAVVTPTAVQTLTNKTFDNPITIKQVATPSNPSSGYDKLYLKQDDNVYVLNSAGGEQVVGGFKITTETSNSTLTPTGYALRNLYLVTALATDATIAAPSGTPTNGNTLIIRITDDGTARTLSWNTIYRAIGTQLPTSTTANKTIYCGFIYNSTASKWDCLAVQTEQ